MHGYKSALVTGASSGIGRGLASALADRGLEVHALARRRDLLDALASETGCIPIAVDLTDAKALEAALAGLEIDVLVNAAGMAIGFHRVFEQPRLADLDTMVNVNLAAVLRTLRLVVPGMVARDRGHIVNIGSIYGLNPNGGATTYCSLKAGVHQLSQCLRADLLGRRIRVTEVCPARVATGFHAAALGADADTARKAFYDGREPLTAEDVTAAVLYALEAPLHVNVTMIELAPLMQGPTGIAFVDPIKP